MENPNVDLVAWLKKRDQDVIYGAMSGFMWQNQQLIVNLKYAGKSVEGLAMRLADEDYAFRQRILKAIKVDYDELTASLRGFTLTDEQRVQLVAERSDEYPKLCEEWRVSKETAGKSLLE